MAVDAAVSAQRGLLDEAWTTARPLTVRMGLHTGMCEERDNDYDTRVFRSDPRQILKGMVGATYPTRGGGWRNVPLPLRDDLGLRGPCGQNYRTARQQVDLADS